MGKLAILVPVLGRPHRVKPLLESIAATTPEARTLFIADTTDKSELEALDKADAEFISPGGNYATKIWQGVNETEERLLFLGADDLDFKPGWFEAARERLTGNVEVVGVNDLINRVREHATHFLMTREYAKRRTLDRKPGPLFQGYSHWFCDDELIVTAQKRGVYAYCEEAIVEHLHPMAGTAPDDPTYVKGRANRRADSHLFRRRRRLWK